MTPEERATALAAVNRLQRTIGVSSTQVTRDVEAIRKALTADTPRVEWGTADPNGKAAVACSSEESAREWVATTYLPGQRIVVKRSVYTSPWEDAE